MAADTDRHPLRIVHSEAATSFGGQERDIHHQMLAMRARGHHLEAVCQPQAELAARLLDDGFAVHTLLMDGALNYWRGLFRLQRLFRQLRPDILNTHSRRDTMLAGMAGRLARVPLIVRSRHLARRPNSLVSYTGIPHRVLTCSDHVRQQLLDRRVPAGHVATVYSAVEPPVVSRSGKLRSELGLADDAVIVGSVGVLRRPKGHHELIDAMQPLLHQRTRVHLVIVGGGQPLFDQLQSHVADLGLTRQVHLLGERHDAPDLLADFDIFALATRQEALGRVFIEAAAAGLPVVATDVGGVSETLLPGESGFLVPLDDRQALATAIHQLVDDPALRQSMGQAGREFYHESGRFTTQAMVDATEAHYYRWLNDMTP